MMDMRTSEDRNTVYNRASFLKRLLTSERTTFTGAQVTELISELVDKDSSEASIRSLLRSMTVDWNYEQVRAYFNEQYDSGLMSARASNATTNGCKANKMSLADLAMTADATLIRKFHNFGTECLKELRLLIPYDPSNSQGL